MAASEVIQRAKRLALDAIRKVRVQSDSQVFWFQGPPYNFGDWIGPYLYRARTGRDPVFRKPSNRGLTTVHLTVGSLVHVIHENCIVWGTGLIKRGSTFPEPHETRAVRGPWTRERFLELGYPCPAVYGDPAILMPLYYTPRRMNGRPIAMVPHYVHLEEARGLYGADEAISIVDVTSPVESVIDAIASAEVVISSSLHGVIVAHAYGRPAALGRFGRGLAGDGVKFEDYFAAGGVAGPVDALDLTSPTRADVIRAHIEAAPMPDLESLRPTLIEACPF